MLAKVLLWLHQSCAEGCNLSFGPRIGGAVGVAVLATFVLLRQQNIWLERRCNDAERGWAVGEWLFKINIGLAFIGLIFVQSRPAVDCAGLGAICLRLGAACQPLAQYPRLSASRHARAAPCRMGATVLAAVLPLIVFV